MKIAVCLSGEFRAFTKCWPSIVKHVAQGHECDFFIHTWNTLLDSDPNIVQYITPKFKLYAIQQQICFDTSQYIGDRHNTISMFYSIKMANLLKQFSELYQGFKYDYVVRCRTDLDFFEDVPYDVSDKISAPDFGDRYIGDQFAHGPSDLMDVYSSCYDFLRHPDVLKESLKPEETLGTYLLDVAKVPINIFQAQYRLIR